ncbi:MAG TPA: PaaI family thioesterase [Acidimicrobiales bacterium]|nr:PaaI family thioesterase [Acidimicrobiales bacterium]
MSDDLFPDVRRHVLGRLGLSFDEDRSAVRLPDEPVLLDPDGHVNFGVLGVLLDMGSSGALAGEEFSPWVHADIAVHRLRAPQGALSTTARTLRRGKRTGVVELDVHDASGALVAASTQQITFLGPPPEPASDMSERHGAFQSMFDGRCHLTEPLPEYLGIRDDGDGTWSMDHGPDRTNGMSGLHGGVATTFVDAAAAGAVRRARGGPARTVSAAVRYLRPALHGPFSVTPEVLHDDGRVAVVRTPVLDVEGTLVISADVHVG